MSDVSPVIDALDEAEQRIAWILAHSAMSAWLKDALHSATLGDRADPVRLLNDLELLRHLLQPWIRARIDRAAAQRP